jgi:hypothetical protein
MNKNLITGLGVLAVAGVAYYFWRRSQLVLAKDKKAEFFGEDGSLITPYYNATATDTTTTVSPSLTIVPNKTDTTTASGELTIVPIKTQTAPTTTPVKTVTPISTPVVMPSAVVSPPRMIKRTQKRSDKISKFYGEDMLENPYMGIKTYPFGRYNNVNRMVDEANF